MDKENVLEQHPNIYIYIIHNIYDIWHIYIYICVYITLR